MDNGYIKLWRKMIEWEWFKKPNTCHLFNYLLLRASYKNTKFQGIDINKGQVIFGLKQAKIDTGISTQSLRTSLNHLKSTGEITIKPTNKFSIITICNYSTYQNTEEQTNSLTNNQTNNQLTINQQSTNNIQEVKNIRNKEYIYPTKEEVISYFRDKGHTTPETEGLTFWSFYDSKNWMVGKNKMTNWRSAVAGWINRNKKTENKDNGSGSWIPKKKIVL